MCWDGGRHLCGEGIDIERSRAVQVARHPDVPILHSPRCCRTSSSLRVPLMACG